MTGSRSDVAGSDDGRGPLSLDDVGLCSECDHVEHAGRRCHIVLAMSDAYEATYCACVLPHGVRRVLCLTLYIIEDCADTEPGAGER